MFGLSKPLLYGLAALVIAAVIIAAGAVIRSDLMTVGEQGAFDAIRKENEDAGEAAEKRRADMRRCLDRGGLFVYETGACEL